MEEAITADQRQRARIGAAVDAAFDEQTEFLAELVGAPTQPALVYGPFIAWPHGADECVDLASLRRVAKVIALFIADWCGAEES